MAKYLQRFGTEKKNFIITVRLISLYAEVQSKTFFSIQWKRGPQTEDSSVFEVNPLNGNTTIINDSFTRQSQIYKDTKTGKYLKKTCNFKIKKWESASSRVIDEVELDMAPFIGVSSQDSITRVKFPNSDASYNAVLEIEFKLHEGTLQSGIEEEQDDENLRQTTYSPHMLEDEVYRLNQQMGEYQRQISDQRSIQERLENELQRKDQQLSVLMKQQAQQNNGGSEQQNEKVIRELRKKLEASEEEVQTLQTKNAQSFIELSACSDEISALQRRLQEQAESAVTNTISHAQSQSFISVSAADNNQQNAESLSDYEQDGPSKDDRLSKASTELQQQVDYLQAQLKEAQDQISAERLDKLREVDQLQEKLYNCQEELQRYKVHVEELTSQVNEYRSESNGDQYKEERAKLIQEFDEERKALNYKIEELKGQVPQQEAPMKNLLQQKMESALMKQIKDLEIKLDAANHAATTGMRFDDFDRFAY